MLATAEENHQMKIEVNENETYNFLTDFDFAVELPNSTTCEASSMMDTKKISMIVDVLCRINLTTICTT